MEVRCRRRPGWALSSVSDSRAPGRGTAPQLQPCSQFRLLVHRDDLKLQRSPRYGKASRALPFQNQQVVFVQLQPFLSFSCLSASSAPWGLASNPFFAPSRSPNRIFRYGALAQNIPSVPRVFISSELFPSVYFSALKLRTSHLQMLSISSTAASLGISLHLAIPENCCEGSRSQGPTSASAPKLLIRPLFECMLLSSALTLPLACVWYTEAMATPPSHPTSCRPCGFLFM